MPSNGERGVSQVELETRMLDGIMAQLQFAEDGPNQPHALTHVGELTARLVNKGHPAGYVTNQDGTFMVTVEKVSNATMIGRGESNG